MGQIYVLVLVVCTFGLHSQVLAFQSVYRANIHIFKYILLAPTWWSFNQVSHFNFWTTFNCPLIWKIKHGKTRPEMWVISNCNKLPTKDKDHGKDIKWLVSLREFVDISDSWGPEFMIIIVTWQLTNSDTGQWCVGYMWCNQLMFSIKPSGSMSNADWTHNVDTESNLLSTLAMHPCCPCSILLSIHGRLLDQKSFREFSKHQIPKVMLLRLKTNKTIIVRLNNNGKV